MTKTKDDEVNKEIMKLLKEELDSVNSALLYKLTDKKISELVVQKNK